MEIGEEGARRTVHNLTARFGISDNWSMYFAYDLDCMVSLLERLDFEKAGTYITPDIVTGPRYFHQKMHYRPGIIMAQVVTGLDPLEEGSEPDPVADLLKEFNLEIRLHPYQEKPVPEGWERVMADVVIRIVEAAIQEKIPFCLPHWQEKDYFSGDPSEFLYFRPEGPKE